MTTIEKAAVMARVSTGRQLDNTSPDEQLRRGREYCAEQGYQIMAERTEAMSGAFVLARSDIMALLEEAEKGRLDVIVFDIPDRLGRGEAISKLELLAELHGARIEFARPGRDRNTMEGFVAHSTDQLVSGIERLNIGRRTKEGKQATARKGQIIASPRRPFGYRIVSLYDDHGRKTDCHMEVIDVEAATVRTIFDWYVFGGLSVHGISRKLTEAGVPTLGMLEAGPGGAARMWHAATVRQVLHNETYSGTWRYGKRAIRRIDGLGKIHYETTFRPTSETIAVAVPAIVSPDIWTDAQRRLEANRHKGHKPTKREYLLRGRVRCARCGAGLVGQSRDEYLRYYRCRHNSSNFFGDSHCPAKAMRGDHAESALWDKLTVLMKDREKMLEQVRADGEEAQRAHKVIGGTILGLEEQDRKGRAKLDNWLDMCGDGLMTKAQYREKKAKIDAEIEARAKERADLKAQLRARPILSPDVEAELLSLADDVSLGMEHATFEESVRLLDLLRVEGIYDDQAGDLTITGALGAHTLSVTSG